MAKNDVNKLYSELINEINVLLEFLRAKFPVFHNSNFFFRDLQFGIKSFFEKRNIKLSYSESETLAKQIAEFLKKEGIFVETSSQSWKVNYPEFETSKPGDPFSY
ncbi:MAG: hypothetical protein KatS3mg036_0562 [Ignavibacterium sp.]|uniref:hypothetical protein n=1 Tax=Ignavibacterium sp. TaxID=2651167 RepID=UPI0021DDFC45|nr:hypothetical protein [Ignavibacterium sp.]BDQ01984.1 MAG: hypothetical protein KatS3mg037_0559 [Ignavibacterium sp.]GIV45744.1 MAG: hypothetical protein KatS3mg036_0562 [Ignavibacterium sp.]